MKISLSACLKIPWILRINAGSMFHLRGMVLFGLIERFDPVWMLPAYTACIRALNQFFTSAR